MISNVWYDLSREPKLLANMALNMLDGFPYMLTPVESLSPTGVRLMAPERDSLLMAPAGDSLLNGLLWWRLALSNEWLSWLMSGLCLPDSVRNDSGRTDWYKVVSSDLPRMVSCEIGCPDWSVMMPCVLRLTDGSVLLSLVGTARSLLSAFFLLFRLRFFTFGVSTGGIAWDKKRYKILKKDTKYLKKINIPYPPPPPPPPKIPLPLELCKRFTPICLAIYWKQPTHAFQL